TEQGGLGAGKAEAAGQRRQRPAAIGIGRLVQIRLDQPELGVARRLVGEGIEQGGEGLHQVPSSSRPARWRASASIPIERAMWTRASSRPCVTHTLGAPTSFSVWQSSLQSAWSETTSGNSAPLWRARARTRIQPEHTAGTGSAKRRDHLSAMADGG